MIRWEVWTREPACSGCPACVGVLPCRMEDHGRHTVAAARVLRDGRPALDNGRTVLLCSCGAVSVSHAPSAFHEAAGPIEAKLGPREDGRP